MKVPRQQLLLDLSCSAACWKIASNTAGSIRIPEAPMMSLHHDHVVCHHELDSVRHHHPCTHMTFVMPCHNDTANRTYMMNGVPTRPHDLKVLLQAAELPEAAFRSRAGCHCTLQRLSLVACSQWLTQTRLYIHFKNRSQKVLKAFF